MIKIHYRPIFGAGIVYLSLSGIIFMLGWCRGYIGIPLAIAIVVGVVMAIRRQEDRKIECSTKRLIVVTGILLCWVMSSGLGGLVWQNSWDHMFRNAVYRDLVNYPWPVVDGEETLCYYFGYWLPSALIGKLIGMEAGYVFQLLWGMIGVVLTFLMMSFFLGKIRVANALIFIFFSGLDIVSMLILSRDVSSTFHGIISTLHIELVLRWFNSSSNTTLLYWLYNQSIPFWLCFTMILTQKDARSVVFIYALCFFFSTFPCIGLFPVVAYLVLSQGEPIRSVRNVVENIKKSITVENLIAIPYLLIIYIFEQANASSRQMGLIEINGEVVRNYIIYWIVEFGVYFAFVVYGHRRDVLFYILLVTGIVCPFIRIGFSFDFAWRTNIPLSFYTMLLVMEYLDKREKRWKKGWLVAVLAVGAITPMHEMLRTVEKERLVLKGLIEPRNNDVQSFFDRDFTHVYRNNFVTESNNFFMRHIARQNETERE